MNSSKRMVHYDVVRLLATMAVIVAHATGLYYYEGEVNSASWLSINIFSSATRWSIPAFVMISGALFLCRDIPVGTLYKKYILRIITAFLFWTLAYGAYTYRKGASLAYCIMLVRAGYYHMWFLFMIVGLYVITPLVRRIVISEDMTKYFLLVAAVATFIVPRALNWGEYLAPQGTETWNNIVGQFDFKFTLGYVSYFVLGYYLSQQEIPKKIRVALYVLCVLSFIGGYIESCAVSISTGERSSMPYGPMSINCLLQATGIFVAAKYWFAKREVSDRMASLMSKLSKYSFGAYLIHAMILDFWSTYIGIDSISSNRVLSIIVISIIVYALSMVLSMIINQIPVLKKYIV